jgi:NADH:ubiquinone reductase (non-electrogenic)
VFTDDHLRVKGSDGSIFACGDAATIHYPNALELANALFDKAGEDEVRRLWVRLAILHIRSYLLLRSRFVV